MKSIKTIILAFSLIAFLASCERDKKNNTKDQPTSSSIKGIYILNEGTWGGNNASLTYYDFVTGKTYEDYFEYKTQRKLGDVANDIQIYGSKMYIIVNVSSRIEILDLNGNFIDSIPLKTGNKAREPRCIAFNAGKAYVTAFDGTVIKIDTATLKEEASISVGLSPDGICIANNKIYVANSGGKEYATGYDKTVSIIDIATFSEIKKINVVVNPYKLWVNGNDIFLLSRGNYADAFYTLQKISALTDEVAIIPNIAPENFAINNNIAYCYTFDYTTLTDTIRAWNISTNAYLSDNFITDGSTVSIPYGIDVDKISGDVFVCDAVSFLGERGYLYCFDKNGKKKYTIDAGLNPSKIVLIR